MAAAVLAVVTSFTPARAAHAGTCGGVWTGSASCQFFLRGAPIRITGTSSVGSGNARVRVWVDVTEVYGVASGPTIMECSATKAARASCTNEVGADRTADSTQQLLLVICRVEGTGSGSYECRSGLGI